MYILIGLEMDQSPTFFCRVQSSSLLLIHIMFIPAGGYQDNLIFAYMFVTSP